MGFWQSTLEVLRYTIPALVVFATVYYVLLRMLQHQTNLKAMELKHEQSQSNMELKMQAYERLALFCERISIPQLLYRIKPGSLSANAYLSTLVMAIQQEYEHNFSQQVYVSDKLWKIIDLAKNQTAELLHGIADNMSPSASGVQVRERINTAYSQLGNDPSRVAIEAIKKEVKLYL